MILGRKVALKGRRSIVLAPLFSLASAFSLSEKIFSVSGNFSSNFFSGRIFLVLFLKDSRDERKKCLLFLVGLYSFEQILLELGRLANYTEGFSNLTP